MAIDKHVHAVLDGSSAAFSDRTIVGVQMNVANLAGGSAGTAVTTAVVFAEELPANYAVYVTPNQDATAYVSGKTSSGFNVVITPRLAASTLAAGTFDVMVVG